MITQAFLYTSEYKKTLAFYQSLFRNQVKEVSSEQFSLEFLLNTLTFSEEKNDEQPFYHFAFLIPYSHFDQAKNYFSDHVSLTVQDGKDEISFKKGIRSFYFYDPSGNVVEVIAKDSVEIPRNTDFSVESILGLAEMSLVTESLESTAFQLFDHRILKQDPKSIKKESLTFISSEETTLLLSPVGRTWLFSDKKSEVFPQTILIDNYKIEVDSLKKVSVSKNDTSA